ncbi:class I SAM-dependent methyltransferase [Helicobacter sp. T3_23-1059]
MKLHLGCWHRNIPDFINVDLCDMPHIHYKSSIDDLSMFEDESAGLIYSSHSFEYFDRFEAVNVIKEWHRVLKKGGTLRLAVPDFDKLIEVYHLTGDLTKILGPLYGRMSVKNANAQNPNRNDSNAKDSVGGDLMIYHKTVWNFTLLSEFLQSNGFSDVRRYDWRTTIHKDYDDHSQAYYPHLDKENGILISLNVEATKI